MDYLVNFIAMTMLLVVTCLAIFLAGLVIFTIGMSVWEGIKYVYSILKRLKSNDDKKDDNSMKIEDGKLIVNAVNAVWVEISPEVFRSQNFKEMKEIIIGNKDIWFLGENPQLIYEQGFKYYAEESVYKTLQPKRKEGWYRATFINTDYGYGLDVVVNYKTSDNQFYIGCDAFGNEDFFWIDEEPIQF